MIIGDCYFFYHALRDNRLISSKQGTTYGVNRGTIKEDSPHPSS
jgi:hypothetical protein